MQCALCEYVVLPMFINVDVRGPRSTKDVSVGLRLLGPALPGSRSTETLTIMCHSPFSFFVFSFLPESDL